MFNRTSKHDKLVKQATKDISPDTTTKLLNIMAQYCYPGNPQDRAELEAINKILATR